MSCRFEEEVCLLFDSEELERSRRVVVEAHLAVCESCRRIEQANDLVEQVLGSGAAEPLGVIDLAVATIPERSRRGAFWAVGALAAAVILLAVLAMRSPEVIAPAPTDPEAELPPPSVVPGMAQLIATRPAHEVARLVVAGGAAATSELKRMLGSGSPEEVRRALAVAERAPSPWLTSGVIALLSDEVLMARAARLLGSIGSDQAVPALEAALSGRAGIEAREALVAIGGDSAAAALARHAVGDEGILDALVRIDLRRGAALLADSKAPEVLKRRRAELLPELRRLARGGNPGAIRSLGLARDRESIPMLASLSREREAAAVALLDMRDEAATRAAFRSIARGGVPAKTFAKATHAEDYLLRVFTDGHSFAERQTALELLGYCGGDRARRAIIGQRLSSGLLPTAIVALRRLGGVASARYLVDLVIKGPFGQEAGRALAALPAAEVVPVLLESYDPRHVRRVLVRIAGSDLGRDLGSWQRWWSSRS